ncbi:porin [Burkholderia sp. 3C]
MAHAQASVTLYGIVDGGLFFASKTRDAVTGRNDGKQVSFTDSGVSPSQFGIKGIEPLGGGLAAEFRLESGINVGTGGFNDSNGNFFGRQAYVGLTGRFGEIKAGLQLSPFMLAVYELDPRGFSEFGSSLPIYIDNIVVTGFFTPNAVSYTSPNIAGFQGSVLLSLGGVAGDFQNGRQYAASLKYDNGPLLVSASMLSANASTGSALMTPVPSQLPVSVAGRQLGAAYRFGTVTAKASFVNYRAGNRSNDVYGGGLDFRATPTLDLNAGVWYQLQHHESNNHSLLAAAGVEYFLSTKTTLYCQMAVVNNHGTMDTGLSISNVLFGAEGTTVGADLGIRHNF